MIVDKVSNLYLYTLFVLIHYNILINLIRTVTLPKVNT